MTKNAFQRIHEIIETSSLTHEEKRDFTELFAQTKEDALKPVLKLLENDASWVEKLYANYRAKREAVVTGNMETWRETIAKQKEELERI